MAKLTPGYRGAIVENRNAARTVTMQYVVRIRARRAQSRPTYVGKARKKKAQLQKVLAKDGPRSGPSNSRKPLAIAPAAPKVPDAIPMSGGHDDIKRGGLSI